jgi:hypothetical protein
MRPDDGPTVQAALVAPGAADPEAGTEASGADLDGDGTSTAAGGTGVVDLAQHCTYA